MICVCWEKKVYSLSVGCWSHHMSTKLLEMIILFRTVEALEELYIFCWQTYQDGGQVLHCGPQQLLNLYLRV